MKSLNLSILLVEDHLEAALLFSKLLTRAGHSVALVGSCADAIIRARHARFDVLMCDLGLPDGDGCALLKALRQLYPIAALAMTGYAHPRDRDRASEAGFYYFLAKPVDFRTVEVLLATIAGRRKTLDYRSAEFISAGLEQQGSPIYGEHMSA
jgi:CheY-like chemotaxis protein